MVEGTKRKTVGGSCAKEKWNRESETQKADKKGLYRPQGRKERPGGKGPGEGNVSRQESERDRILPRYATEEKRIQAG